MTDMSSPLRVEPAPDVVTSAEGPVGHAAETYVSPEAPPSLPSEARAGADPSAQQLSRIEDKTARIEEKYARSEALLLRMGDKVDAATARMNETARQADLTALRNEVAALSQRTRRLPGAPTLVAMMILTVILTAIATAYAIRYGFPGLPAR